MIVIQILALIYSSKIFKSNFDKTMFVTVSSIIPEAEPTISFVIDIAIDINLLNVIKVIKSLANVTKYCLATHYGVLFKSSKTA